MKTKSILILSAAFVVSIALTTASKAAVNINIIASSGASQPLYVSSSGASLANNLIRIGVLDESGYGALSAAQQNDFALVDALFTEVATANFDGSGEIFALGVSGTFTSAGQPLYVWAFNDTVAASATEWGLFHASPSTAAPWVMPPDLGTVSLTSGFIDTIAKGSFDSTNYRLAAVPEPSTYAMMALGLVVLLVARRRMVAARQ